MSRAGRDPARGPGTAAARAGISADAPFRAVVPPVHLSTTFAFDGFGRQGRYDYTRSGNPTRDLLADALAELEGGAAATVTASGMAAVLLALQLLRPTDLLIAPHDCYGGSFRLIRALAERGAFRAAFIDLTDPDTVAAALERGPRMVWVETPSNPLLRITDIRAVAERCRRAGALLAVDNTFLSPALQRPIVLGADLVVHSTTKYINGHSDVVGGAVIAADAGLHEELAWWANCMGLAGSPFDGWLTLRGLRTLRARMALHQENAAALVELLRLHPAVRRVHYPGLPDHPGHALARRQQDGFGAMVAFELRGGEPAVRRCVEGLRHFSLAESLGGVESLIAHPATMTHASMDAEARRAAGIGEGLLRISAGIEDAEDLLEDLRAALDRSLAGDRGHDRKPATRTRDGSTVSLGTPGAGAAP